MRQLSLYNANDWSNNMMSTANINGISYVVPKAGVSNYSIIQNYIATQLSNDPRIYEEPTILVLNGTNVAGVAGAEKSKLEEEGYKNVTADNAPEGEYPDDLTLYALTSEKPGTKTLLEQFYNLASKSPEDLPENIPKDYDFILILGEKEESSTE
jgi:hypothetical protein